MVLEFRSFDVALSCIFRLEVREILHIVFVSIGLLIVSKLFVVTLLEGAGMRFKRLLLVRIQLLPPLTN